MILLALALLQTPIKIEAARAVFQRGEVATLRIVSSQPAEVDTGGFQRATVQPSGEYRLETAKLAPGTYTVTAKSGASTGTLKVTLVDAPNPDRFPIWKWGGTAPRSFAYYAQRGFTGVGSPMVSAPLVPGAKSTTDIKLSLDEALRHGFDYGLYLNPLLDARWKGLPETLAERHDGQKLPIPYPRDPSVKSFAEEVARSVAATFGKHPAFGQALLGSEFQLDYNFGERAATYGMAEAGVDVRTAAIVNQPAANKPKDGVIEDDNPRYRYLKWWFHRGMGDAEVNSAMARILAGENPRALSWHDPYRLAPVRGSAEGLGALSTWTYAQPDMTRLLYTRVLQAAAKPSGQRVMQTITLFLYPRFVQSVAGSVTGLENDKPGGNDYFTAGPDFATEAIWMAFSQRPDVLGVYFGGLLQPDDPNVERERASPETFDAIGKVVRDLVEPYGPAIRAGRPMRARVAVLLSAASLWLGENPRNVGYPNEQILPYCSLLAMNHIPFEVILDEDVTAGRLSDFEVLVMPQAGAITRSMLERIQRFAASGGKIVADKALSSEVKAAIRTDYDFTFQRRVDGVELSKGNAVTAEENRKNMEALAADLRGKFPQTTKFAEADSPRAIVNVVENGPLKFVFVVNDNRELGPRFGSSKLHLEKGTPLTTRVTIRTGDPVYDVSTGEKVPAGSFAAQLPGAGGKLFVVVPQGIPDPTVSIPTMEAGKPARIVATLGPKSGGYPVRIEILDPTGKPRVDWYLATKDGAASATFLPAENDPAGTYTVRVTDLVTRKTLTGSFAR